MTVEEFISCLREKILVQERFNALLVELHQMRKLALGNIRYRHLLMNQPTHAATSHPDQELRNDLAEPCLSEQSLDETQSQYLDQNDEYMANTHVDPFAQVTQSLKTFACLPSRTTRPSTP